MIKVFESIEDLSRAAADYINELSRTAITNKDVFYVTLAGGSTPKKLYELLATDYRDKIDWAKWQVFFSDERFVPLDDENSNFGLAYKTLLSKVPVPAEHVHVIHEEADSVSMAAAAYEADIKAVLKDEPFDLILLGLGSDGHTASLFPGKPALQETEKLVVASEPGILPPPVERITLTLPLINSAKNVAFLAAGADKTEMVKQATQGGDIPAAKVHLASGEAVWFIDRAASKINEAADLL